MLTTTQKFQNGVLETVNPLLFTPQEMKHNTRLHGLVNGQKFDLYGDGWGKPYEGYLDTDLKSKNGEIHFPMTILSPIALMGYPTYSTYQAGSTDLFKISDGYSYKRHFEFENNGLLNKSEKGFMDSEHRIKRINNELVGDFEVLDADIDMAGVIGLEENCIETFYPSGKGKIKSFFKMRWIKDDGRYLSANVESEYTLHHDYELPFVHFRMVKFMTHHTQDNLKQAEILSVFYDIEKINNLIKN